MPQLGIIAALASLAATGTELGMSLANRPSAPKPQPAPAGVTALQNQQRTNAERSAISGQTPNVLSATSGLANPEYVAQISQLLAGTAGQPGSRGAADAIIRQVFGLPAVPGAGPGAVPAGTQGTNFTPASASNANLTVPPPGGSGISDFVSSFVA